MQGLVGAEPVIGQDWSWKIESRGQDGTVDGEQMEFSSVGDPEDFEEEESDGGDEEEEQEEVESGSAAGLARTDARLAVPESPTSQAETAPGEAAQRRKTGVPSKPGFGLLGWKNAARGVSPGSEVETEQAPKGRKKNHKASLAIHEQNEIHRLQGAMQGAQQGNWRDLKTVFQFAGIYPPKDDAASGTG